jgi:predicted RecB family nuclease
MIDLITSQIVEAMTLCPRKAFFMVHGAPKPDRNEYEAIIEQRTSENRLRFLDATANGQSMSSLPLPTLALCSNGVLETTSLRAECDSVSQPKQQTEKRHRAFEPHIVVGTHSATKEKSLRLAFAGFVIGETRRYRPSSGWIIPMSLKPMRVSIDSRYPVVHKAVAELRDFIAESSSDPPPLALNSHCPLCPVRKHCQDEAEKADHLTLLDRITPKLLKR